MGGEGVTQRMAAYLFGDAGCLEVFFDQFINALAREGLRIVIEEKMRIGTLWPMGKIRFECLGDFFVQGNGPGGESLAVSDRQRSLGEGNIRKMQVAEF